MNLAPDEVKALIRHQADCLLIMTTPGTNAARSAAAKDFAEVGERIKALAGLLTSDDHSASQAAA